jgi:hypothetical protein
MRQHYPSTRIVTGAGTPRKAGAQSEGDFFLLTSSFIEQPARAEST